MKTTPSSPLLDARERLRAAVRNERLRLVPGTPEKYPLTAVRVRLLDLEALLAATRTKETSRKETR